MEEMTPEKLDEICSEFAGLELETRFIHESRCGARTDRCDCPDRPPAKAYQSVSTDWAAAGRLMDALREKKILVYPRPSFGGWTGVVREAHNRAEIHQLADSGPRALCLAVAALAAACKKETV